VKRQDGGLTVQQCDQQKSRSLRRHKRDKVERNILLIPLIDQCNNAQQSAQVQNFQTGLPSTNIGPDPQFPDFDLICDG
jgi:hypothetical protein